MVVNVKINKQGGAFTTGLMVGFLLGVMASLAVIMFIKSSDSPFAVQSVANETQLADKIANDARKAKDKAKESAINTADKMQKLVKDTTNFDFYSILPGREAKVSVEEESDIVQQENVDISSAELVEKPMYYLQVSASKSEEEADNLKAKLALQGIEAMVQAANIPDKGIWYRVRVGPLNNISQINRTKANLINNGFQADLIKVKQ